MFELPVWAATIAGAAIGFLCGYFVRLSRLCSFGAVEDALIGKDWRRMKIFGLALAIAIAATQAMVLAGWLDPVKSTFVPVRMPYLSVALGALLFGFGMAYVGTCAFGSLVRLGGGDMRSFLVILVFAIVAYSVLRGVLAPLRIGVLEQFYVGGPGGRQISLADLVAYYASADLRLYVTVALVALFAVPALVDRRLWRAVRLLTASLVLGFGVAAGWYFTGVAVDPFAEPPSRLESLTFVAPTARAVLLIAAPESALAGFGVASVGGVVAGSFAHAIRAKEFRWEAFDDQYEMRRHIVGAVCMGAGGILAGGCTIGQGLTAGSMLSLTWPLAVAGIVVGARAGLAVLLEGSLLEWLRLRLPGRKRSMQ